MPDAGPELVDITPSPRILQVLGDIEFDHWQCLAELIDNGFDEFLEIKRAGVAGQEPLSVTVSLPKTGAPDPTVEIRDNGRGIGIETIRDAVRAGFSGNNQFDKLGLFGMGFNIATARLGNVARVLSKRAGDTEWRGVEIDLLGIASRGDFKAPVISEPADDPSEHGTRVIISKLKPEQRDYLSRPANLNRLREKLGDVYGYLLERESFNLYVAGQAVKPRKACVWDKNREVTRRRYGTKETISAILPIDEQLPDREACGNCRHWQDPGLGHCQVCGSSDPSLRSRRIHGWLGIQRYADPSDFGIDFLRNGRKILLRDKRIFRWDDPDDDTNEVREYPVEVPYEGRIVGEIHIDHVPVNYQKNAFEYDGVAWRTVVGKLRGEGPVQPLKRKERGYDTPNNSPFARLFDGYRRLDPGLDYLVPGNGQTAAKAKALEWAKAFRKGDSAYQTDEQWYEAAKQHDKLIEQAKLAGVGAGPGAGGDEEDDPAAVLAGMGLGDESAPDGGTGAGEDPATAPTSAAPESEEQRQDRYKSGGEPLSWLSADYSLPSVGHIKVEAYWVTGTRVQNQDGLLTPVYLSPRKGGAGFYAFLDAESPIFKSFGADRADLLLTEIAHQLKTRGSSAEPLTKLVETLKSRHLPDLRLNAQTLSANARELLTRVCESFADGVGTRSPAIWAALTVPEREEVIARATLANETLSTDPGSSGAFLRHLPYLLIGRLVDRVPELLLDGDVLGPNYAALSPENEAARQVAKERAVSLLVETALLAESSSPSAAELNRGRYTLDLLAAETKDAGPDPVTTGF